MSSATNTMPWESALALKWLEFNPAAHTRRRHVMAVLVDVDKSLSEPGNLDQLYTDMDTQIFNNAYMGGRESIPQVLVDYLADLAAWGTYCKFSSLAA